MIIPVLFGALGLFGAAVMTSESGSQRGCGCQRQCRCGQGFGAVSHSMGGRGRGAGAGAASSMGGRQVSTPYDWDSPSGTVMRWDRRGGIYGAVDSGDLKSANQETASLVQGFGGTVLRTGAVVLEGHGPGFYTEMSLASPGVANQAVQASKALASKYGADGDFIWLFAGENRYVLLWTEDGPAYLDRWMDVLHSSKGNFVNIEKVFGEDFGFMLFGIPFGKESRIESLENKIESATGKISSLEAEAKNEGANIEKLAKKIARYEQKKEKWEDKLETLQMKESMGFDDLLDDDDDSYGADDGYFPPGAAYGEAIDDLLDDDDDEFGAYDLLGDRIADEMFSESFGGRMGTQPHVGHQRTAIELGEHILG